MPDGPTIGQRVTLVTMLKEGDFPGEVVETSEWSELCVVKLDCQDALVTGVRYYPEETDEICGGHWQACWPEQTEEALQCHTNES